MDLYSLDLKELTDFFLKKGIPSFRAKQIFQWVYQKKVDSFDKMTNLPLDLRKSLSTFFYFSTLKLKDQKVSKDEQTNKFVFELQDHHFIESVLILSGKRRTLCVSSQVGCRGGCVFCASGKKGYIRNLSVSEIVEQIVIVDRLLSDKNENLTNIVFMGMGEPLDNLEAVIKSIFIINEKEGLNISQRKITISTVGLIDKISLLLDYWAKRSDKSLKVNLTLSLHAPNQKIRESLLPFSKKNGFEELMEIMEEYYLQTKRDITFEYILIEGINDQLIHAKELVKVFSAFREKSHLSLNLIPYNTVLGLSFRRPTKEAVDLFKFELEKAGLKVSQRYTKGKDIDAACGQLAFLNAKS